MQSPRFKLGRLAAVRPTGLLDLIAYLVTALKPPPSFPAPKTTYPIDCNDRIGDCTIAGVAHCIAAWNKLFGHADPVPGEKPIETEYFRLTGGEDTGLVEADVLSTWKKKPGLFGATIFGYAPVSVKDPEMIRRAIAFYGGCYLGIECPASAQDQFAAGKPWSYVPGSPIEGGHCIVALGYRANGDLECATWGKIVLVEASFIEHFLEEAWCILPHQLVAAQKDTLGIDLAQLQADLAKI